MFPCSHFHHNKKLNVLNKSASAARLVYLLLVIAVCGISTGLTGRILMPSLMTLFRYGS